MPTITKEQKEFANSVEDDIRNQIGKDVTEDGKKTTTSDDKSEASEKGGGDSTPEKNVDTNKKKADNKSDDTKGGEEDQTNLYDAVVSKVLAEEFDGDESKMDEAKGVANLAIKTFGGDPIKAAKSYKNLFDQAHSLKTVVKQNPFIDKLIKEASQGKTIDENYVKSVLGTATSADQPSSNDKPKAQDQLSDDDLDDFDPDKLTADQLMDSGVLDKTKYETATSIDKRDMLEKAKVRYAYKVLPSKIAERTVKLTKQKADDATKQERINKAKESNTTRLRNSQRDFITKHNVDFENNPEHAKLYEEIFNKAVRLPDIDDDSGMLVADDAFERAAKHVFQKNGITLEQPDITKKPDENNKTPDTTKLTTSSEDIMRRILTGANSFKGNKASPPQKSPERKTETGNDLNSQVKERVSQELSRNRSNTKMISGLRRTDRTKN